MGVRNLKCKIVHIVGIGGIGTSALARFFLAQNWLVSGSDLFSSNITQDLRKSGVRVKIGAHEAQNVPKKARLVVYSPAVPSRTNIELRTAREKGLRVLPYPKAVSEASVGYKLVAVAGTHGKSTTTSFLSLAMGQGGLDPTVIVGTRLKEFGDSNFRRGGGEYFVVEADEWKGSFLHYSPFAAILTNIDKDHLDYYKNFSDIKKAFLEFISRISRGSHADQREGILVLNADDPGIRSVRSRIEKIMSQNNLDLEWYSLRSPAAQRVEKVLKVPGRHNVSNGLAAYTLARKLGAKSGDILKAFGKYKGAWRRMERRGQFKVQSSKFKVSVFVFDDYAHHPTEIKATLAAFRDKYPKHDIICVYQPHQALRLKLLFDDFGVAFHDADVTVLCPTYQVAGRDPVRVHARPGRATSNGASSAGGKYDSAALAEEIVQRDPRARVYFLEDLRKIRGTLKEILGSGDYHSPIVVMMGAGDIFEYTKLLVNG